MKKTLQLTDFDLGFIEAMCSNDPAAWDAWGKSHGFTTVEDVPVDLTSIPKKNWIDNSMILPTSAIQSYLDSGDTLTQHTIRMMELAMEKAFGIEDPWYVDCTREGSEENGTLKVLFFAIMRKC